MNKEIKAKWVAWLRDPAHKQATGALRKDDAFCCLGGLCEVYKEETGRGEWQPFSTMYHPEPYKYSFLSAVGALPSVVAEWAGLEYDNDPLVCATEFSHCPIKLSNLNDGFTDNSSKVRRLTFAEIADIIEKGL